jgi:hypothetical protein
VTHFESGILDHLRTTVVSHQYACEMPPIPETNFKMSHYRFLGTFDQAAVGHKILDPPEAGEIMTLVEQHQAQNLADAGNRLELVEGLCVVRPGRLHDSQCDSAGSLVRVVY